jgi:hypothetical protein
MYFLTNGRQTAMLYSSFLTIFYVQDKQGTEQEEYEKNKKEDYQTFVKEESCFSKEKTYAQKKEFSLEEKKECFSSTKRKNDKKNPEGFEIKEKGNKI